MTLDEAKNYADQLTMLCVKYNDEEAINLLNILNIPLNLTFSMDPNDDYSVTYNI
jgi:hypothetical protein